MGGVLTAIFGGGGRTTEKVSVDPTTQALNDLRLQELSKLFGDVPFGEFIGERPDIYSPTD